MSKADLFSINPEFQYNPNVLNIKEDKTIEHASRVFDEKLKILMLHIIKYMPKQIL